jgi:protein-disulfide isomerase
MKNVIATLTIVCVLMSNAPLVSSQEAPKNILAQVNGTAITEEQVKAEAANELESMELKKAQFDIGFSRDKSAVYDRALSSLIDKTIVESEAKKRGLTPEALVWWEVDHNAKVPTEQQVTAIWNEKKDSTSATRSDALEQIRGYLTQQARLRAYQELMRTLREQYKVETYLEPLRVSVATEGFPVRGSEQAPVTLVEFADFECPFCAQLFPTLQAIMKNYSGKVRLVYREFPLIGIHPHAQKAAEAALCANEQQRFWEMHDAIFENNTLLDVPALKQKALGLGVDAVAFDACLDSSKYAISIASEVHEGAKVGVSSTPTLFINGRYVNGAQPYADIAKVIDEELLKISNKTPTQ